MNLANRLINGFLHSELELFKKGRKKPIISESQDLRGLAIAWVCYYFEILIDEENRRNIINYVKEIHEKLHANYHIRYEIMGLEAAAFLITNDESYAIELFSKCAGHSSPRSHAIECSAIICSQVDFYNPRLRKPVEANIKYVQGYWEESTILYLNTKGMAKDKKAWVLRQSKISRDFQKNFFNEILEGSEYYSSSFFVSAISRAKSYFIFKILSNPELRKTQQTLFDHLPLNFEVLMNQENIHPLSTRYIDFSFLNEK